MTALAILGGAVALLAVILAACMVYVFRRTRGDRAKKARSVTAFLFMSTQAASLVCVSTSYILAAYATVALGEPFPVTDLSEQAIITLLGNGVLKTVANIFEHNNGGIFGQSDAGDGQKPQEKDIFDTV